MSSITNMPLVDKPRPRLVVVAPAAVEGVRTDWLASAWHAVKATASRLWNWMRRTLHLDPVVEHIKTGARWVFTKAKVVAHWLGLPGFLGAGLMTVSTSSGRRFLDNTIGAVARAIGSGINWCVTMLVRGLDHLGAPGRWAADRIVDVHEFFVGNIGKPGLVEQVKSFVSGTMSMDTPNRKAVFSGLTLVGYTMLGLRLLTVFSGGLIGMAVAVAAATGFVVVSTDFWVALRPAKPALLVAVDDVANEVKKGVDKVIDPTAPAAPVVEPKMDPVLAKTTGVDESKIPASGNRAGRRAANQPKVYPAARGSRNGAAAK